jgi:tripartite-type tricarboxylate transporter receptor subunit TctC
MKVCRTAFPPTATSVAAAIVALLIFTTSNSAWPQAKTIKVIVPFPAGGGVDIVARLMAAQVGRTGQNTFVVENRPGAGTQIGTEAVARALPDGNTILFVANSFIINPSLRNLAYNPLTSFEPICLLARSPNVFVVNSMSPYQSLGELLDAARARPGMLTMAFQGPGTAQHIGTEKLKRMANVDMINVPFTGSAPAVNAILGDHVTALFVNYPAVEQQVSAGRIRVLAAASQTRIETLPNVPTVAEVLQSDFVEDTWTGSLVPAKTPKDAVTQLAGWFHNAILAAELRPKLAALGYSPAGTCEEEYGAFLRRQVGEYSQTIRDANIKAE